MDKKIIKKVFYIISGLIIFIGLFVVADYFTLFGTNTNVKLDFVEARLRAIDAETDSLVMNVGVRCFQKNNSNACTRRESHQVGVVSVHIPVRRVIEKSLFFKRSEEIIKAADPKIHIMLLHKDYYNPTKTLLLDDVYENKINEYEVEMPPRDWGDAQQEQEEEANE